MAKAKKSGGGGFVFILLIIVAGGGAAAYFTGNIPGLQPPGADSGGDLVTGDGDATRAATFDETVSPDGGTRTFTMHAGAFPLDAQDTITDPAEINAALAVLGLPEVTSGAKVEGGTYVWRDYPLGTLRVVRSGDRTSIDSIIVDAPAGQTVAGTTPKPTATPDTPLGKLEAEKAELESRLAAAQSNADEAATLVNNGDEVYRQNRDRKLEQYLTLTDRVRLYESNPNPALRDKLDEAKLELAALGPVPTQELDAYKTKRAELRAKVETANESLDKATRRVEEITAELAKVDAAIRKLTSIAAKPEKFVPDVTVYVVPNGSNYHRPTCGSLNPDRQPLPLKKALEHYDACIICNPPKPI